MALLEAGRIVPDTWLRAADGDPLPDGPTIIGLARLETEAPTLLARNTPLGVELPNDVAPARIARMLDRLAVVVLHFPKHRDGRAFTQARALREQLGFRGEIRAAGHVIPDLYAFMLRCGFSSVEVPDGTDPTPWAAARAVIPIGYQAAVAGDAPLGVLRRRVALG